MGKKYLLTFSLAVLSCLATKSLQSVIDESEELVEIVNSESQMPENSGQLTSDTDLKIN